MTYSVSITSQGQISIPAKIRRKLGLYNKALVSENQGKLVIEPVKDFLELAGSLKTNKKPLSNDQLDEIVATAVAEEYAKRIGKNRNK